MTLDSRSVSAAEIGSLGNCLVEGSAQDERRSRRIKQGALFLSVVFQTLVVAALLLFPLLGKSERISLDRHIIPPSPRLGNRTDAHPRPHAGPVLHTCKACFSLKNPHTVHTHETKSDTSSASDPTIDSDQPGDPRGLVDGILNSNSHEGPARPVEETRQPQQKRRISLGQIDPAKLINRIEPIYPKLAMQIGRQGRVEMHAIIATDGTIQSLEVISGDPLLIPSALDAVRQWRYRPTYLNNIPVEVDTHITVVYTLNR